MKKITLGFVAVLFAAAVTLGSGTAVKAAEEATGHTLCIIPLTMHL